MAKILKFVKPNKDKYELDQIDCFEKATSIAVEGMGAHYDSYYYMLMKCFHLYGFREEKDNVFYFTSYEVLDLLGLRLHVNSLSGDIHQKIREQIDLNRPVLFVGDLNALYYWENSNTTKHSNHMFVIRGYDIERGIYHILDNMHKNKELNRFDVFLMTPEIIDMISRSANVHFGFEHFLSVEKLHSEFQGINLIIRCIEEIQAASQKGSCIEISMMEKYQALAAEKKVTELEDISKKLVNTAKHKHVLYHELYILIKRIWGNVNFLAQFAEKTEQNVKSWQVLIQNFLLSNFRDNTFIIHEKANGALATEQAVRNLLAEALPALYALSDEQDNAENDSQSLWIEENNDDGVISQQSGSIRFTYETAEVYNGDARDQNPKLMYRNTSLLAKDFTLTTRLSINTLQESAPYCAGIVIQTLDEEVYTWGVMYGNRIVLSQNGVLENLFSYEGALTEVRLGMRREGNRYIFSCVMQGEGSVDMFSTEVIDNPARVGIGCKNWGPINPLYLEFTDLEIKSHL